LVEVVPGGQEFAQRGVVQARGSEYLYPSPRRDGVPYFTRCELRHTVATRLSAGSVAGHMITQMPRQGDADAFKLCSQAKLVMMREALAKLDRQANKRGEISSTVRPNRAISDTFIGTAGAPRALWRKDDTKEVVWSGRRDLNSGPLAPQASALARLRHGPMTSTILAHWEGGAKWTARLRKPKSPRTRYNRNGGLGGGRQSRHPSRRTEVVSVRRRCSPPRRPRQAGADTVARTGSSLSEKWILIR
jgi:hypothetical protein